MKKHMNLKKITAFLLAAAMILTGIQLTPQDVQAASVKRKLSKSSVTLNVGKSTSLSLMRETKYKGKDKKYHTKWVADKTKAKWSSSNSKAVKVSSSGKVTAVKAGTATISAKVSGKTYKCTVKAVAPTVRRLSKSSVTVVTGKTTTLTLQKKSGSKWVTDKTKASWSSSSKSVATVSSTGKVTALKPGKVTISAKVSGKTYKCIVTVSPVRKLNSTSLKLKAGSTYTLKLLTANYTVTNGKLSGKWVDDKTSATWSVNGKGNISVNSKGVITIKAGDGAVVYAKKDGKTYSCKVSVINPEPEKKPESKPEDNKKPESGNTNGGNGGSQSGNTSGNGESNSGNGGSTSGNGGNTSGNGGSTSGNTGNTSGNGGNAGNTELSGRAWIEEYFGSEAVKKIDETCKGGVLYSWDQYDWIKDFTLYTSDRKKKLAFVEIGNPFSTEKTYHKVIDGVAYAAYGDASGTGDYYAGKPFSLKLKVCIVNPNRFTDGSNEYYKYTEMTPSELRSYGINVLIDGKEIQDSATVLPGEHTLSIVGKTDSAKNVLKNALPESEKEGKLTFCYTDKKIIETRDTTGCPPEKKQLWDKIFQVTDEIIKDGMTERDKVKAIHDWIVKNTTYDVASFNLIHQGKGNETPDWIHVEIGPLLHGRAVCDGYAWTFNYLALTAGLQSRFVEGPVYYKDGTCPGAHAWNQVFVDGKWYFIDCTWDDYDFADDTEYVDYEYFLSEEIWDNHKIDKIYSIWTGE